MVVLKWLESLGIGALELSSAADATYATCGGRPGLGLGLGLAMPAGMLQRALPQQQEGSRQILESRSGGLRP